MFKELFFTSQGRIGRLDYLLGYLSAIVMTYSFSWFVFSFIMKSGLFFVASHICVLYFVGNITIKRFHDLGRSAWYLLLFCIPVVNVLTWVFLLLAKGQRRENFYGPSQKSLFFRTDTDEKMVLTSDKDSESLEDLQALLDKKFNQKKVI